MAQLTSFLTGQNTSLLTSFLSGLFDPLTLSPALWLDGTDQNVMTLGPGNKVVQWDDKASSFNATQGVVSQQPTFGPFAIGNNSAPNFDGSDDKMVIATLNWPLEFQFFIVIEPVSVSGQKRIISSYDGSGGFQFTGEYFLQVVNGFLQFQAANLSPPLITPSASISPNTPYLLELTSDPSKNLEMFVNNVSVDTGTHGTTGATKPINIGMDDPATGSVHFRGDYGTIMMFNSILAANDKANLVNGYFAKRFPTIGL